MAITIRLIDIKRKIKAYYGPLYAYNTDKFDEMDNFLKYSQQKKETDHFNRSIFLKKVYSISNKSKQKT